MFATLRFGLESWAYVPGEGRDLRIDLLRGLAVLAMVVDHIAGPSKLYLLTGGNQFYTSAAEGFIFLSGLTVGLVYRRVAERYGLATALRRLLERAWTLYLLAVGLTLVMLPFSELLQPKGWFGMLAGHRSVQASPLPIAATPRGPEAAPAPSATPPPAPEGSQ